MSKEKYDYIHYFSFANSPFNKTIIEILKNNDDFDFSLNLFIFTNLDEYNFYKDKCNCIFSNNMVKIINKYGHNAKIVFFHGVCSPMCLFMIKSKILKKTIWRTWGSDMRLGIIENSKIKKNINKVFNFFIKKRVHRLLAVGIANDIDLLDITDRFGECKTIEVPYYFEEYDIIKQHITQGFILNKKINIMLGHSGFDIDNHIAILERLQKNKKFRDFAIYCPVSYGDVDYICGLEKYIASYHLDNVFLITDHKPLYEYVSFINDMDLIILDGLKSYAIGNISISLSLGINICLNKDGILSKVFSKNNIPFSLSDNIQFDDIKHKNKMLNIPINNLTIHDKKYYISQWKKILSLVKSTGQDI